MNQGIIPLPQLPRALRSLTGAENAPSYRHLYNAVINGLLPAEHQNGRWYFRQDDLPAIAVKLGLTKAPSAASSGKPRQRAGAAAAAAS